MFAHVKPPQLSSLARLVPSKVPHKVRQLFFVSPSCRSKESMDTLEHVALPIFSIKITEKKYLLPEKMFPRIILASLS